jgi:hypothetical protein
MMMPEATGIGAAIAAALDSVLPGAQCLSLAGGQGISEGLSSDVALPMRIGVGHALLRLGAGAGFCAALLARMLGREPTAAEVDEMGREALAEFCNLVGGHLAGHLGEQGLAVTIGTPEASGAIGGCAWQQWQYEGQQFAIALQEESTA